jgi:hypothetical protein
MRSLNDNHASAVPLILFVLTIVVAGALYSLFFIEIGFPILNLLIVPASDTKTVIMMALYGLPLIVLIVGVVSLFLSAIKNEAIFYQSGNP